MSENTIQCPECGAAVSLDEALAAKMRHKVEAHFREEAKVLAAKAAAEVAEKSKLEIADLKAQVKERAKRASDFESAELKLRAQVRVLEDQEKNRQVELQRALDAERKRVEVETTARLTDEVRLKAAEKDKQLDAMRKQIDDLKRKAEQGSQQTQGEVLELEIEALLKALFPGDAIEPVAKGVHGADIIQGVTLPSGKVAGKITWETKRAKTWSNAWITKIKEDQRDEGAEHAVLVTQVMPGKSAKKAQLIDGVWVVDYATCDLLAHALRHQIISVVQARSASESKGTKMDSLYEYFTGTDFRQRIEALVDTFVAMREDLEKERRAITKAWAARDTQITRMLDATAGMYGDLQGIVGRSLPVIKQLELEPAE